MENNDSPYIYEKPLRSKRSKQGQGLFALGLVAIGTLIGGGAFANALSADAAPEIQANDQPVATNVENATDAVVTDDGLLASTSVAVDPTQAPIIAVPLDQATPKKNSAAIQLPALPTQNYGNTSSATPSASGGQTGSNVSGGSYKSGEREGRGDRDRDEREDYEDEYED